MKNLFDTTQNLLNRDFILLLLRIVSAGLMLTHGIPKLRKLFSGNIQFPPIFGLSPKSSLALTVFSEVLCSSLLLFGLGTRLAVIPLAITMLVAVFYVHLADPIAKKELGLLYLSLYITLFIAGSGKYSADYLLENKVQNTTVQNTRPVQVRNSELVFQDNMRFGKGL